jgi:alkylhydroperoxidase family enzyme
MTWIKTISRDEAEGALRAAIEGQRALYPAEYATPGFTGAGPGESIVESHSLIPEALFHAFATFGALMDPALPLARQQHEMIATVVSAVNRCHY